MTLLKYILLFLLPMMAFAGGLSAQVTVKGHVYDNSRNYPLEGVNVHSNSGKATQTDTTGYYHLTLNESDSIWFSYLGKATPKYGVASIRYKMGFDIALQIESPNLPGVTIWKPSYKMDSLANREDYKKIFGYQKPGFSTSTLPVGSGSVGVGVDLEELINVFRFRRNKRWASLQNRLILEEEEKYVDYRFNKNFVMELTSLSGDSLVNFMNRYRPEYTFVKDVSKAELGIYIIECFKAMSHSPDVSPAMIQHRIRIYDY